MHIVEIQRSLNNEFYLMQRTVHSRTASVVPWYKVVLRWLMSLMLWYFGFGIMVAINPCRYKLF